MYVQTGMYIEIHNLIGGNKSQIRDVWWFYLYDSVHRFHTTIIKKIQQVVVVVVVRMMMMLSNLRSVGGRNAILKIHQRTMAGSASSSTSSVSTTQDKSTVRL